MSETWEPSYVAVRHAIRITSEGPLQPRGEGGVCKQYDVPERAASAAAPAPKNRSPEASDQEVGGSPRSCAAKRRGRGRVKIKSVQLCRHETMLHLAASITVPLLRQNLGQ